MCNFGFFGLNLSVSKCQKYHFKIVGNVFQTLLKTMLERFINKTQLVSYIKITLPPSYYIVLIVFFNFSWIHKQNYRGGHHILWRRHLPIMKCWKVNLIESFYSWPDRIKLNRTANWGNQNLPWHSTVPGIEQAIFSKN